MAIRQLCSCQTQVASEVGVITPQLILVLPVGHLLPAGLQDSHLVDSSLIWFKGLLPGNVGSQRIPGHREGSGLSHSVRKWALPSLPRRLKCPTGLTPLWVISLKSCYHLHLDCS